MNDAQANHSRLAEVAAKLGLHEHLCLIYDTQEEQFAAALPYLRAGLGRREKCFYVADENSAAAVLDGLRKGGTDVDSHLRKGALAIISKNDIYLKIGRFEPDLVVGFWTEAAMQAKADGFPGLRILAEMTWMLGESGAPARLLEFESQINHMFHDHDATGICQYNRAHFSPEVILGVIRTHPLVVYGRLVSKNPYYVPPDEFLKPNQAAREVDRLLKNILEREQAHQTLRRSEERWRSVFENSAIGVALTDLNGRFLAANRVYQKLVGYTEQELRTFSFLDITHKDYRASNWALITELVEGKRRQFQIEKKYRRKDGSLIWVSNNVSLVPGFEGVPRCIMALSEDITERKAAEERLRLVVDTTPALIHSARPDGYIDYFNRGWLDFVGLPMDEVRGWHWTKTLHPDDVEGVVGKWRAALASGEPFEAEGRVRRFDGEYRTLLHRKVPLREERGDVVKWYGWSIDIEDRRRAENALRESEERFRALFQTVQVGVVVSDPNAKASMANPAALDLLGVTEQQLRGTSSYDPKWSAFYEDGSPCPPPAHPIPRAIATREPVRNMVLGVDRPVLGDRVWMLVNAQPQCAPDGSVNRVICTFMDITERKRAEDSLRESEARFRVLADAAPVMIWMSGTNMLCNFFNKPWLRFTGRTMEQESGNGWSEGVHPEDLQLCLETYVSSFGSRKPFTMEYRLRRADGEYRWILDNGVPRYRPEGEFAGYIGSAIDITERKRAEDELRRQKEILQKIFDNVPVMINFTGTDGRMELVNREWERTIGWTLEEIRKQKVDIFAETYPDPQDRQKVLDFIAGAEGKFADFKTRIRDGRVIDTSWARVRLSDGTSIGIGRDITERKRVEERLRQSEADFAAAQRVARLGTWRFDAVANTVRWSEELYRIFDVEKTAFGGTYESFLSRVHPDDRPRVVEANRKARASGEPFDLGYRIVTRAGELKDIREVGSAIKDATGAVVSLFGTAQDITERKRAEDERERSRDQLRALAARLQSVREEERTRVAREIHDELGQALTAIRLDLSSLVHGLPSEKKQECGSILKLVDQTIQSVRRISTELRPVVLDALGLVPALEWAAEEFETRTGTKCRLDLPQDDLAIDPEQSTALFRIFQETLTNVARHANAAEVNVRLVKEDGSLTLEVHDNGKGISQEQLAASRSLGLLGMRERALLVGGGLTVSGALGKGTTVRVRIPATPSAPVEDHS